MNPHSGKYGVVNGQSTVRNWQVTHGMVAAKFVASNTQGGTGRRRGVKSWSGSFSQYGGIPIVMPGEYFDFGGYTAPDNDVSGAGKVYVGNAIVDNIALTVDWKSGAIIAYQTNFSGHLAMTIDDDEYTDVTDPEAYESCEASLFYSNDSASSSGQAAGFELWTNVTQVQLNIQAANGSYVNSSTGCWTGRKPGPIDWSLSVSEENDDGLAAREKGEYLDLRLHINETLFWGLRWGVVETFSGMNVDRESGAIIGRTVQLSMNGFYGGNVGHILKPGPVAWWP